MKGFGRLAPQGNMNTAMTRSMVWIPAGLATLIAAVALQAGCDAKHFLGTLDGGTPGAGGTVAIGTGGAGATGIADASAAGGTTSIGGGGAGGRETPRDASGTIITDAGPSGPDVGVLGASQSWTGYVENYQFPSGSDLISITFASDAAGNMVGTVTMGTGTPPPLATDPNVGYPPIVTTLSQNALASFGPAQYVAEGFGYPMDDGILLADRMRIDVNLYDLWQSWCALETPPVDGSGFCVPDWSGIDSQSTSGQAICSLINPANNQPVQVDCGKELLCQAAICACNANSCTARQGSNSGKLSFDLSITNERADGSVIGELGTHNVHLTQVVQDH
jgi:hypothetical protein